MIKIKKLIVLLMAVVVCASTAACQRDSSNDGAVKDPPDNTQNVRAYPALTNLIIQTIPPRPLKVSETPS